MRPGKKSAEIGTNGPVSFNERTFAIAFFISLISLILSGCLFRTATNEYDLKKAVNSGKMPASELESIAYTLRTSVEQSHRANSQWLYYWMNAQGVRMCGRVSVDNSRMTKADIPSEAIKLQDIVMVVARVEYRGNTEAELDNSQEVPITKIVEGKLIYQEDHWEVESFEEQPENLLSDICAIQIKR